MANGRMFIPGLDPLVWGELRRMEMRGRTTANAGDLYRRLRKRLRRAEKFGRQWDVVSVLGSMLRFAGLRSA